MLEKPQKYFLDTVNLGPGETAQQFKMLAAFPEDLSSDLGTCARLLTTTCNSSSRGFSTLFWPLQVLPTETHIPINK